MRRYGQEALWRATGPAYGKITRIFPYVHMLIIYAIVLPFSPLARAVAPTAPAGATSEGTHKGRPYPCKTI